MNTVLPENWMERKVSELCTLGRGRVISAQEIAKHPGSYPVYSSQSQNNGEMGRLDTFDFDGELVTWTTDGAYAGTVFYRDGRFNCTNVCGTLTPKDDSVSVKFLSYLLATETKKHVSYVGNPKLMNNIVADIKLRLPQDVNEQRKIAEILSALDDAIAQTEALIRKQERVKQGLMSDLLPRGVDENGEVRPSAEDAPELYRETTLGLLPKEWEILQIREARKSITSGSRWWAKYYADDGALFLRIGNLTRKHINLRFDTVQRVRTPNDAESKRTAVDEGDVLVSVTADLGIIGVIPPNFEEAYINQHIALVKVNRETTNPRWLGHFLAGQLGQKQFITLNDSGAKAGLNLPTVDSLYFANPPQSERDVIVEILDNQDIAIEIEREYLAKLTHLKRGLMQDLLSGAVRVGQG